MESFIKYLEEKIEGCEMTKAPYRDKIIYQLVLDEYKEQLLLHNVVGQSEQLVCDTKGNRCKDSSMDRNGYCRICGEDIAN